MRTMMPTIVPLNRAAAEIFTCSAGAGVLLVDLVAVTALEIVGEQFNYVSCVSAPILCPRPVWHASLEWLKG